MGETRADGDYVIASHPFMMESYVVAQIVGPPTKAMVNLRYYQAGRDKWADEPKRRKLDAIIGKVPDGVDIAKIGQRLVSAEGELVASQKRARASFYKTVRGLIAPTPATASL